MAIDPKAKHVVTDSGEKITYENVVLATGGTPRRLPIPGGNLENVYTLRHVQDAQKIDAGRSCHFMVMYALLTPKVSS